MLRLGFMETSTKYIRLRLGFQGNGFPKIKLWKVGPPNAILEVCNFSSSHKRDNHSKPKAF